MTQIGDFEQPPVVNEVTVDPGAWRRLHSSVGNLFDRVGDRLSGDYQMMQRAGLAGLAVAGAVVTLAETAPSTAYAGDTAALSASPRPDSLAAKKCSPGKQIQLSLVGPQEITSTTPTTYKLNAKSCDSTTPKHLKNITLEEIGPGNSRKHWMVKDFPAATTKQRQLRLAFPAEKAANNGGAAEQEITLEALRRGKVIGMARPILKYADVKTGSTGPSGTTDSTGSTGSTGEKLEPGIYISGPTTVPERTPENYQITVVSPRSYKGADLFIAVPENITNTRQVIDLVAYQPWTETVTIEFASTHGMADEGIGVGLVSPPSPKGSHTIFTQDYPLTPAPNTSS